MRIESARLAFAADHRDTRTVQRRSSLRAWVDGAAPASPPRGDRVTLSTPSASPPQPTAASAQGDDAVESPKLLAMRILLEALTGHRIRLLRPTDLRGSGAPVNLPTAQGGAAQAAPAPEGLGWGIELTASRKTVEAEQTVVSAQGVVRTADGREIAVAVELAMSRVSTETDEMRFAAGDALRPRDPLVLNLTAAPAGLSDRTSALDLEGDGEKEAVPLLNAGSAYLVFDRNGNGAVDDGTELFGPTKGDGFAELGALDSDGNGWIDEADPAFSRLRLWALDAGGAETLTALRDGGVGALSLGRVESPFSLKGADGRLQAEVRSTGVYLKEDGGAGTIQQLDLVV